MINLNKTLDTSCKFITVDERIFLLEMWIDNLRSGSFIQASGMLRRHRIDIAGQIQWEHSPVGVLVQMLVDEPRYLGNWSWEGLTYTGAGTSPRAWLLSLMGLHKTCSLSRDRSWHAHIEWLAGRGGLTFKHIADIIEHQMLPDLAKYSLVPKTQRS